MKLLIFGILMLALIAVPALACTPPCGPGEEWGIIIPAHLGDCHECHPYSPPYDCHLFEPGFEYCGYFHWHLHHQHTIPAVYGCIAVSCPAIPCEEGFDCIEGICTPVPVPESFAPYDESIRVNSCSDLVNAPVVVEADRHDIPYVALSGKYASTFDTLEIFTCHGEYLSDGFYNPVVDGMRIYGGMPTVNVFNPMQAIRIRGAKDSLTETTLPMTLTLRDDTGAVLYTGTTTEQVMDVSIVLSR